MKTIFIFRMKLPELLWTEVQAVGWKYQSWLQVGFLNQVLSDKICPRKGPLFELFGGTRHFLEKLQV